jgi:gluconolactonase
MSNPPMRPSRRDALRGLAALCLAPAAVRANPVTPLGTIERLDPRLDAIIPKDAVVERLADGFDWSEGPVWFPEDGGYLLFSDVPRNTVYRWREGETSASEFLKPSGFTGPKPRGGEPGSNGLVRDRDGRLILMQHGDRRVARLKPGGGFETIADRYDGRRFNSPNDGCLKSDGSLYFTDPPYGLEKGVDDPARELDFQGVYRVAPDGKVTLLTKELSRPNGIAFSPDESTLYVANSDPERAIWMAYPVRIDGTLGDGRVFADVTRSVNQPGKKGLPDGMKVDRAGHLFATGPGGVLIFDADGTHLGTLATGEATANCGFGGDDRSTLYITADMFLARVRTSTRG